MGECKDDGGRAAFVFARFRQSVTRLVGTVALQPDVYKELTAEPEAVHQVRHLPMVVPPLPWTDHLDGGYVLNRESIMRTHGCKLQRMCLEGSDMPKVYDGLNSLGSTPWKINTEILELQEEAYKKGMTVGDLPSQVDFEVPEVKDFDNTDTPFTEDRKAIDKEDPRYPAFKERFLEFNEAQKRAGQTRQRNYELHSLRCDTRIKVRVCEEPYFCFAKRRPSKHYDTARLYFLYSVLLPFLYFVLLRSSSPLLIFNKPD